MPDNENISVYRDENLFDDMFCLYLFHRLLVAYGWLNIFKLVRWTFQELIFY